MTGTTINHKPWCREHQTDYEGEHCFSGGFEFGPMKPAHPDFPAHRAGDIWAAQQLGVDEEPTVFLEYSNGANSLTMKVEDLLPLREAIDGLLGVVGIEVDAPR